MKMSEAKGYPDSMWTPVDRARGRRLKGYFLNTDVFLFDTNSYGKYEKHRFSIREEIIRKFSGKI